MLKRAATPSQGQVNERHHRSHMPVMSNLTVWHDGDCPLCRREISIMRRLDRRGAIQFVDVRGISESACPVERQELLARFHALEDGRLLSGAAAFGAMWRAIPLLRPMGLAARIPWLLNLFERLYVHFLRVRPYLHRAAKGANR